ncbi:conserved hypothetical protein [Exiguobacterium sp. 8H]|uniref:hypothetical protein n=1 Tax=unclassified Exiguobacterium TaxID=2644629 RepID=UPI0012F0AC21|nr:MULTISPECIES: hypothetical protein [unclassified Exiguobacterium]VXB49853.1 conserved hypothetical protein [Exiguobacterium sp. 8A]VXB50924.1 conserved hypothetical protein [Exiguobacterium sp. 8H]
MKSEQILRLLGEVDDRYIEESMMIERKPYQRLKWGAGFLIAVAAGFMLFTSNVWNEQIPLSTDSTANSVHIVDQSKVKPDISEENMMEMTEDELFSKWNPVVVRGTVTNIWHIEIDFNGETEYQSLIKIQVSSVYRGDVRVGQDLIVRADAITETGQTTDASVISHVKQGMEGIFMPIPYDDEFVWEQNEATLRLKDIADYGFPDGERYLFLDTPNGLLFERDAYPSLQGLDSLDEVEHWMMTRFSE